MRVLVGRRATGVLLLTAIAFANSSFAQLRTTPTKSGPNPSETVKTDGLRPLEVSVIPAYYSQTDGMMLAAIVRRAFDNNGEIKIARLEIEKAQARLTQARLRPNPTLEVQQTSGRLAGSPGDSEFSAGVSVPLEIYGQRTRRIDLANAEITLKEAEVTARQRILASQIFATY